MAPFHDRLPAVVEWSRQTWNFKPSSQTTALLVMMLLLPALLLLLLSALLLLLLLLPSVCQPLGSALIYSGSAAHTSSIFQSFNTGADTWCRCCGVLLPHLSRALSSPSVLSSLMTECNGGSQNLRSRSRE